MQWESSILIILAYGTGAYGKRSGWWLFVLWALVVMGIMAAVYDYNTELNSEMMAKHRIYSDVTWILIGLIGLLIRSIIIHRNREYSGYEH
jgi:hypothetical protein